MLNEYPRQQLKTLISQFGRAVCDDPKRCEAILRDLCPQYRRETNLLVSALKEKVVADLLKSSSSVPSSLQINQLAQRLHDNLGIAEHFALWAVESWALALGLIQQAKTHSCADLSCFKNLKGLNTSASKASSTVLSAQAPAVPISKFTNTLAKLFNYPIKNASAPPAPTLYPAIFFHDKFRNSKPAIKMVRITGGRFLMGSPDDESGRYTIEREHEVYIHDFILGQYAVSFAEYDVFVKATSGRKPSDNGWGRGLRPVINISWREALSYAAWLSEQTGFLYRLPTEAEWEYACRAGTTTPFSTGEFISTEQANFNGSLDYGAEVQVGQHRKQTVEVGSFAANQFGLYDMHGNVWEWTASSYSENYSGEETRCFDVSVDTYRMLRGGSWVNTKRSVRSASRIRRDANDRADFIGFRLARDV
jgi:formylglycine-generating enzyme required for sulfatase activity